MRALSMLLLTAALAGCGSSDDAPAKDDGDASEVISDVVTGDEVVSDVVTGDEVVSDVVDDVKPDTPSDASGDGTTDIPPHSDVIEIQAKGYNSMAIDSMGNVIAWGRNWAGQTDVPTDLGPCRTIGLGLQ